ncbi:hypothetical protein [Amycolatopsis sp. NPDC003861]
MEKLRDREAIRGCYEFLFGTMLEERIEPVSRRYGGDFLVDECRVTCLTGEDGRMTRGNVWQGPPVPVGG